MGLAKNTMFLFIVFFALVGVSMGTVYKVGDSAGWTNIHHVDYKTWSSTKNFYVRDIIGTSLPSFFHFLFFFLYFTCDVCSILY